MHYHAEVWIPYSYSTVQVEDSVSGVMAPYYEEASEHGFWDWYQIGGRWKGAHVPGYDPNTDPDNIESVCRMCGGTGRRTDGNVRRWYQEETDKSEFVIEPNGLVSVKCNVCDGSGKAMKWPTEWTPHPKDVMPVDEIPDSLTSHTLILPGVVLHQEEYIPPADENLPGKFEKTPFNLKEVLREHGINTGYLVTVDYHN